MRTDINIEYESLIALLQGKELHVQNGENHFIFHPPFDGLFVTHDQLDALIHNKQAEILQMLGLIKKHKQEQK